MDGGGDPGKTHVWKWGKAHQEEGAARAQASQRVTAGDAGSSWWAEARQAATEHFNCQVKALHEIPGLWDVDVEDPS